MPRGIKNAVAEEVAEVAPDERRFSDEKDHKGLGHPLCLNCGHREDMHHVWKHVQRIEEYRDRMGVVNQKTVVDRLQDYDANKPCQHACKCTEYK